MKPHQQFCDKSPPSLPFHSSVLQIVWSTGLFSLEIIIIFWRKMSSGFLMVKEEEKTKPRAALAPPQAPPRLCSWLSFSACKYCSREYFPPPTHRTSMKINELMCIKHYELLKYKDNGTLFVSCWGQDRAILTLFLQTPLKSTPR